MRLMLNTTGFMYLVTTEAEPKLDDRRIQRTERDSGKPMWVTQFCAMGPDKGGSIISVTTAGQRPEVRRGEWATPVGLEAVEWKLKDGRTGLSYRAEEINAAVSTAMKAKQPAA